MRRGWRGAQMEGNKDTMQGKRPKPLRRGQITRYKERDCIPWKSLRILCLYIKEEVHDVSVLDDIFLAFDSELSCGSAG